MRISTATLAVLLSLGLANHCWAAPQASTISQQPFTEEQAASLLSANNHLPNVTRVAFYEDWEKKPQDIADILDTYKAQKEAIKAVGARKWVNLIPPLISYMDYPAEGAMRTTPPVGGMEGGIIFETSRLWPAFKAIYSFGPQSVAPLTTVIRNPATEMRLRITALQVLYAIDKTQAQAEGKELVHSALENKQRPLAELVNQVINGQKRFWGIVDFQPITMSAEEAAEILKVENHLEKPNLAMRGFKLPNPNASQSSKDAAKARFDTYSQQKEAIRIAGELKLIELIPNLLSYMDYPGDGSAYIISMGSFSLPSRRRRWPALDAIMKMGTDAIAPLQQSVADKTRTFELRRTALSALRDLAPEQAMAPGQLLLQEAKQAGDAERQDSIQYILESDENKSLLSQLNRRTQPKSEVSKDQLKVVEPK